MRLNALAQSHTSFPRQEPDGMHRPTLDLIMMPTMACNLACDYCYVLDKYAGTMPIALAKQSIEQVVTHNDTRLSTKVYWHGAEPLLAGIGFYREMCAWTRELYGIDTVHHHIQTNGILLNDEWFDLFIQEHITVGVSLDGPPMLHDSHRKTRGGNGTFDSVFENLMNARKKKLYFDALCVITRHTLLHEDALFDFFYDNRIDFGFEPIVPANDEMGRQLAITPLEYAQVAMRLFDRWFFQEERRLRIVVPPYHFLMGIMQGGNTYCNFSTCCARHYIAVSPNGDVHSCIMFAEHPDLSFGNIAHHDLGDILRSSIRKRFLLSRVEHIAQCQQCEWASVCQGGCSHHAYVQYGEWFHPDTFCESYRLIFRHVYQTVEKALASPPVEQGAKPAVGCHFSGQCGALQ